MRKPDSQAEELNSKGPKKVQIAESNVMMAKSPTNAKKEEFLAKVQEIQAKISMIMAKIHEEDQKEGVRIVSEHDPNKMKVDLEFYLASVIGMTQGEKFYYRFCLKKI